MRLARWIVLWVMAMPAGAHAGGLDLQRYRADRATLQSFKKQFAPRRSTEFARYRKDPADRGPLSVEESVAIRWYTNGQMGNYAWNRALRSGKDLGEHLGVIKVLASAINGLPGYRGTVRRRVNVKPKDLARYRVGDIVEEKGFTSTTKDKLFLTPVHRSSSEIPTMFVIRSKGGGRLIDHYSDFNEGEVLFSPGTRFRVVSREIRPIEDPPGVIRRTSEVYPSREYRLDYERIELEEIR